MAVGEQLPEILEIPEVGQGLELARLMVGDRFTEAKEYANNAFGLLENYIADLKSLLESFTIQWESVLDDVEVDAELAPIIRTVVSGRPDTGDINLNEIKQRLDAISLPTLGSVQDAFVVTHYSNTDTLKQNLFAKMIAKLAAEGSGLGADIEDAIWARLLSRQELKNVAMFYEAENYFASRGFAIPPGALAGRLNEINIEIARNNSYANNDIAVEQARLAQTNTHFILSEMWKAVVGTVEGEASAIVALNKGIYDKYVAEYEGVKIQLSRELAYIEAVVKAFATLSDIYKNDVLLASAEMDALSKFNEVKVREALAKAEVALKRADMAIQEAKILFQIQAESYKGVVQNLTQICASAISSVNATASLGFSAGAHASASGSVSEGKQYQQSWSESKSEIKNV